MIPQNPQTFAATVPRQQLQQSQSVYNTLNGNTDFGTPTGNAPTGAGVNAGVYTQFARGNGSGVLIRIAANGVTGTGAPYNWAGSNVGVPINHGLQRQPIGFIVCDKDKTVDIYRTAAPNSTQITLAPTDNSASVTVYIF